jgi:hypothetical protein
MGRLEDPAMARCVRPPRLASRRDVSSSTAPRPSSGWSRCAPSPPLAPPRPEQSLLPAASPLRWRPLPRPARRGWLHDTTEERDKESEHNTQVRMHEQKAKWSTGQPIMPSLSACRAMMAARAICVAGRLTRQCVGRGRRGRDGHGPHHAGHALVDIGRRR